MVYATVTNKLLDEKIYEPINQARHKKKQGPDIEGIYDYMIKVDVLVVEMSFEALEERIKTMEMKGKIVKKKFNDADSFCITQKEGSELILRKPEPYIQSNPDAPLTLATSNSNQSYKSSLRELEAEIMELKSFVLEQ